MARHLPEARWYARAPVEGVAAPFEIACVMPSRHRPDPLSREPEETPMGITCGLQVWAHRVAKGPRGFSATENDSDYMSLLYAGWGTWIVS